jgi:hypothetical protein
MTKPRWEIRYKSSKMTIHTCAVLEGEKPYETAIFHREYLAEKWIVLEAYDNQEQAQAGHEKWIALMNSKNPPQVLKDCCNSFYAKALRDSGVSMKFAKTPKRKKAAHA